MAGKNMNDRELAARVRTLTLEECERQLMKKKGKLYEAVLLRLAGGALPRLNELTGADGKELIVSITGESAKRYDITRISSGNSQGQA